MDLLAESVSFVGFFAANLWVCFLTFKHIHPLFSLSPRACFISPLHLHFLPLSALSPFFLSFFSLPAFFPVTFLPPYPFPLFVSFSLTFSILSLLVFSLVPFLFPVSLFPCFPVSLCCVPVSLQAKLVTLFLHHQTFSVFYWNGWLCRLIFPY